MTAPLSPAERAARALPCAFEDEDLPSYLIPHCSYHKHMSDEFPERCSQYVCPFRYRRAVQRAIEEAVEAAREEWEQDYGPIVTTRGPQSPAAQLRAIAEQLKDDGGPIIKTVGYHGQDAANVLRRIADALEGKL